MKLKKVLSLVAGATVLLSSFGITGCAKKEVLNVYNVGDYIDMTLIDKFQKETGIKVNYSTYDTNELMYQKLKNDPSQYDIVVPSDYMTEKLISEDLLEKIDFNNIPNYKNIDDEFKNPVFDSKNEYSVPYFYGTLGILYNKTSITDKIDSWNTLWDSKYSGKIMMLNSMPDTMGIALKKLGYSMNSKDAKEITSAKDELIKQLPLVKAYVNDEVKQAMLQGEASMAVVYSGDATLLKAEKGGENLEYIVPKEGSNKWIDSLCIPKGAKNKESAEKFINFMLDAENAKQNTEEIGYSTPNKEAKALLDDKIKNDKVAYPDNSVLDNCEYYRNKDKDQLKLYDDAWTEIMSKTK